MAPRPGLVSRLFETFHTHPQGRLFEALFFGGIGALLALADWWAWRTDRLSDPLAVLGGLIAACFVIFALLPQKRRAPPPPEDPKRRSKRRG